MNTHKSVVLIGLIASVLATGICVADDEHLVRIDRKSDADRNALIEMGITLVAEMNDAFLAVGSPAIITGGATSRSLEANAITTIEDGARFALVGLRPGFTEADLMVCGEVIAHGDDWRLVSSRDFSSPGCIDSTGWFIHVLDMDGLAPARPIATEMRRQVPDPLVQEMVDQIDMAFAMTHWQALSESPIWTTRNSTSQGCIDSATYVHALFSSLGLEATYQHHTSGHADNVIGTLPGHTDPDKVYIAIGHLDDLPSSGPAPGADDNASGTAMVTALAAVMSDYCFDRTTKFLAVTGEEYGLYGSDHYADAAAAQGEDIQAVLNADMVGWEGDGQPAIEDLDINYNSTSQWLAQAMIDAADDYNTGLAINAISCSSMVYSDHAPFWDNGFSAVCGITDNEGFCGEGGNYPYYHQSSDTIANCGPGAPAFEAAVIRTYLATMAHLAQPIARIPDPPTGLTAQADGPNRIALSWSDQGPGVTYRVSRAPGGCSAPGPGIELGETGSTTFLDDTASGGVPYAYIVTAIAAGSCGSPPSVCAEATTGGACTEPPVFAGVEEVASAEMSNCRLDLSWQTPEVIWCGGPAAYNVYRSLTPGFTPSQASRVATEIAATSYNDTDVIFEEDYHYIVRAVDLAHGAEDANTNELGSSPTGPLAVGTWADDAGDNGPAKLIPVNPWSVAQGAGVTGAAYATGPYSSNTCAALTSQPLILDAAPSLEFWSKFDIESGWDKGELQVSTNGGGSWSRVSMTYPGSSPNTNDACGLGTGTFFTGTQAAYAPYTASLSTWANQEILLRWLFSSDGYVEEDGWWIDDISITDVAVPSMCFGSEEIFVDDFESGTTTAWAMTYP